MMLALLTAALTIFHISHATKADVVLPVKVNDRVYELRLPAGVSSTRTARVFCAEHVLSAADCEVLLTTLRASRSELRAREAAERAASVAGRRQSDDTDGIAVAAAVSPHSQWRQDLSRAAALRDTGLVLSAFNVLWRAVKKQLYLGRRMTGSAAGSVVGSSNSSDEDSTNWKMVPAELLGRLGETAWMIGGREATGAGVGLDKNETLFALACAREHARAMPGPLALFILGSVMQRCFGRPPRPGDTVVASTRPSISHDAGWEGWQPPEQWEEGTRLLRHVENNLMQRPPFTCRRRFDAAHPLHVPAASAAVAAAGNGRSGDERQRGEAVGYDRDALWFNISRAQHLLRAYELNQSSPDTALAPSAGNMHRLAPVTVMTLDSRAPANTEPNHGPRSWTRPGAPIPRIPLAEMSAERFKREFLLPRRPVVVTGVTDGWAAERLWKWSMLHATFPHVPHFGDWLRSRSCGQSFVDESFFRLHPEVFGHFSPPPFLRGIDDIAFPFGSWMLASYARFMVFSHAGGGTGMHKDAWNNAFWNTCVHGRKRWVLLPDLVAGAVTENARRGAEALIGSLKGQVQIDPHVWYAQVHPLLSRHNMTFYEFHQGPGDLVFVPAGGWFHQVVSLTDTVSVSFNMMLEPDVSVIAKSFCQRTASARNTYMSRRACHVLRELRPQWYGRTCCSAFLSDPEAFPRASELEEAMVFPHANVEFD